MTLATFGARDRLRNLSNQAILLGAAFLLLMLISAAAVWLVDKARDDADAVVSTLDNQNRMALILLNLRRAESAQRGFLLTSQQTYLDDYRRTIEETRASFAEARQSIGENARLSAGIGEIAPLLDQKIGEMNQAVELHQGGAPQQALALVVGGAGRELTDRIRTIAASLYRGERAELDRQRAESEQTGRQLLGLTLTGAALVVLLGGVAVLLVQRSNRAREEAYRAVESARDNLDATVQSRTADLREANAEIQRFAYIVSHDLRSPLVNIMGFTAEIEALRDEVFRELAELRKAQADGTAVAQDAEKERDFNEAIGFIKTSITKMDRLIGAVLRLSREGRREFHPEPLEMEGIVKAIAATVQHQASEADAEIVVERLPSIASDRLAIEQVFSNLLDNALKYLRNGTPGRITVRGREVLLQVVYEVEDNGRGIDPQDHERIFELFRRSGPQDRPGEGIGLAHVRALVRRLGGTLTLQSELGKGTTFRVSLPKYFTVNREGNG